MIKKLFLLFTESDGGVVSVIWYLLGMAVVQGVNLLLTPFFTNMMSVENYGLMSVCTMWISFFSAFITLQTFGSVNNALIKYGANRINEYVSFIQSLSIALFLLFSSLLLVFRNQIIPIMHVNERSYYVIIVSSFFQTAIQLLLTQFIAEKKHKQYFFISLLSTIAITAFSVYFVIVESDSDKYFGKIFGSMIGNIIVGLGVIIYIYIKGGKAGLKLNSVFCKYSIGLSFPLVFHCLSQLVLAQSDRYMLKIFSYNADYEVGIYSYAYTIGLGVSVLWTAANYVWVPWYYQKEKEKEIDEIISIQKKYCMAFTTAVMLFILISPEIVKLFAPLEYSEGMKIVPIIALSYYFLFLYSFPVNYEFYKEKTKWISFGTFLAALLNIVLNYYLIPKFGSFGASITTLVSYFALFVFHYIVSKYVVKNYESKFWLLLRYSCPVIITTVMTCFFLNHIVIRLISIVIIVIVSFFIIRKEYGKKIQSVLKKNSDDK